MNEDKSAQPNQVTAKALIKGWEQRSAREALSEIERELSMRLKCFPRWVEEGRVNEIDAMDRLQRLKQAFELFTRIIKNPDLTVGAILEAYSTSCANMTAQAKLMSNKPVDDDVPF